MIVIFTFANIEIGKAQSNETALEYMQAIDKQLENMKRDTWQFLKSMTRRRSADRVYKKQQNLADEIKSIRADIRKLHAFNSDPSYRDATIEYLDILYIVTTNDYDKILDMEKISEASFDNMEAYLTAQENASEKLRQAYESAAEAQKVFAEKYDITLIEGEGDKLSQKIQRASEALRYYNELYLIFFKSYKQEMYLLAALEEEDLSAVEQNTAVLKSFSEEGLANADKAGNFKGDPTYKQAVKRILWFYNESAQNDYPKIVDFYLAKDEFMKIKQELESKRKKDRTQADADKYNKAAKAYNLAATDVNKRMERLNNKRKSLLESYNEKADLFFEKHTD
jgi:hypothetical protein